jgi:hypothetical protein
VVFLLNLYPEGIGFGQFNKGCRCQIKAFRPRLALGCLPYNHASIIEPETEGPLPVGIDQNIDPARFEPGIEVIINQLFQIPKFRIDRKLDTNIQA